MRTATIRPPAAYATRGRAVRATRHTARLPTLATIQAAHPPPTRHTATLAAPPSASTATQTAAPPQTTSVATATPPDPLLLGLRDELTSLTTAMASLAPRPTVHAATQTDPPGPSPLELELRAANAQLAAAHADLEAADRRLLTLARTSALLRSLDAARLANARDVSVAAAHLAP